MLYIYERLLPIFLLPKALPIQKEFHKQKKNEKRKKERRSILQTTILLESSRRATTFRDPAGCPVNALLEALFFFSFHLFFLLMEQGKDKVDEKLSEKIYIYIYI